MVHPSLGKRGDGRLARRMLFQSGESSPRAFPRRIRRELIAVVTSACFRNLTHKGYIGYMVPRIHIGNANLPFLSISDKTEFSTCEMILTATIVSCVLHEN